ncbi:techylectin-5A-like [Homarus americanus]|uniref:techylectin-5A-like n=1 Tax=Homarus americanus TaxID=6706 RepID=UPI001C47BB4F|nr:techylectin-5A-like [Homarus americanus]
MVKDARCTFQLASLYQEKTRLIEQITELESSPPHLRVPRTTQAILTSRRSIYQGVTTLLHPPPEQQHLYAQTLRPVDCSDYLMMGYTTSGVYNIYPFSCRCSKPVKVWCDMESEGGGWTVFLARNNQTHRENFNRTWNDYREGFGNASGEYWLGNEVLYLMTNTRFYNLRMDFRLITGELKWGEWYKFKVKNEASRYQLEVPSYNGLSTIDHCFSLSNGRYFSTYDYDNDGSSGKNCAQESKGGWWYNNCGNLDPTIPYTPLGQLNTTCTHKNYNKKVPMLGPWLQMKMRPTICSDNVKAVYFNGYTCQSHND